MGCTPTEIKHNLVVVMKENRGDEGSSSLLLTTLLPLKHWSLDLVQHSILSRGARMARRLMLVTHFTPILKISLAATKLRWILLRVILSFMTSRISLLLWSSMTLCMVSLKYNGAQEGITYWKTSPWFLFTLSLNTKWVPTCIVQDMVSKVAIVTMLWYSIWWPLTINLCDCVILTYNNIFSSLQGGITFTSLVLNEIFFMTCNIINAI